MANYRAIKDGDWSDLTVWEDNGWSWTVFSASTELPWIEDNCWANGFLVSIDMNIAVNQLRNAVQWSGVAVVWGSFLVDDNEDRTIIIGETIYGWTVNNVYPLTITDNNDWNTINIVCPKTENAASSWRWVIGVEWPCTINYTGNLNSASYVVAWMYIAVGWVTVNHTGTILPDADSRSHGVRVTLTDNLDEPVIYNLVWNIGHPWLWVGRGIYVENGQFELNMVWNVYRMLAQPAIHILSREQSKFNIDIQWDVSSILWSRLIYLLWNNPYSSFILREGTLSSSDYDWVPVIDVVWADVQTTLHNVNIETDNLFKIIGAEKLNVTHDEPVYWKFRKYGQDYYMYSHPTGQPIPKDVRRGTLYWNNDEMEGTLIVPSKENVAIWVPVDDTVGEACFDLVGIKDRLWVINDWIKKASLLIPHNEDLPED